jgi:hypothetical protein
MSLQIRRGTEAELNNITPAEGELLYTTDTKKVYVGDGATRGGISINSNTGNGYTGSAGEMGYIGYTGSRGNSGYTGSAGSGSSDRLVKGNAELVLETDGIISSVAFPARDGGKIFLSGVEFGAIPADPESTDPFPLILSSQNGEVRISPNALGPRATWKFKQDGSIDVPVPQGGIFTLTLSSANFIPRDGKASLTLSGAPWVIQGQIDRNADGTAELQLNQIFPQVNNPGYESDDAFTFDDQVHRLFGFNLEIVLADVVQAGPSGWTANLLASQLPEYPSTINSNGAIKLTSNENSWTFDIGGNLHLPLGGDIVDSTGTTVLGGGTGGGLSVSDFGQGFTDTLDSGKITTSKLYNKNPNPALNNQYTLEVTNGGVVVLPDQSIINGATLKTVPGNYAGITAGPVGKDEDSWVWVDNDGAWISTKESTTAYTWHFDNNGKLTLPGQSTINNPATVPPIGARYNGFHTPDDADLQYFGTDTITVVFPDPKIAVDLQSYIGNVGVRIRSDQGGVGISVTSIVCVDTVPDVNSSWIVTAPGANFSSDPSSWGGPGNHCIFSNNIASGGITSPGVTITTPSYQRWADDYFTKFGPDHEWKFGTDGALTFPNASTFDGVDFIAKVNDELNLTIPDTSAYIGVKQSNNLNEPAAYMDVYYGKKSRIRTTSLNNQTEYNWYFNPDGSLTLPQGSIIGETATTTVITPPGAAAGQSLVIRPTAVGALSASGNIVPGTNLTITLTNQSGSVDYTGVTYTITGATAQQLGIGSLTGTFSAFSPSGSVPQTTTLVLPIPGNSSATTFTLTVGGANPFNNNSITVTDNGIIETSHVHLVAGNPVTTDIYLGDDDQYVKIVKNGGDVVIGTDSNTNQWTFGTDGALTLPNSSKLRPSTTAYDTALAGWEFIRSGEITDRITNNLVTAEGWPMVNWYPTGATAQGYIDFLLNAWTLQNTAGATLIITPPMSTSFYAQMRAALIAIRDSYNTSTTAVSLSSAYGKSWNFGSTGNTTFPTGLTLGAPRGVNTVNFTCAIDKEFQIETGTASTGKLWRFETNGNTTLPSGLTFKKNGTPYSTIAADLDKVLQIETQTSNGVKQWSFGTDGKLTAPGNLQVDGGKIILNSAGNAYVESVDYGVNSANSAVNIFGGPYQKIKLRAGFGTEATWTFGTDGKLAKLDGLTLTAGGQFNICTIVNAGSGYNTGSALKATTGGSGTGMTVGIGYGLSNQLANVTVVDPGTGYVNGDVITVSEGTGGTFVLTQYNELANQGNNNTVQSDWTFGVDGKLTLPSGLPGTTSIITSGGVGSFGADGSIGIGWSDSYSNPTQISAVTADGNRGVVIQAGAVAAGPPVPDYQWTFHTDGVLTLPNGTNIYGDGLLKVDAVGGFDFTSYIDANGGGEKTWKFGADGSTILPENTLKGYCFTATNAVGNYIPQSAAFMYTDSPLLAKISTIGGAWYIKGPGLVGWKQITAVQDNGTSLIIRIGSGLGPMSDGSEFHSLYHLPNSPDLVYTISHNLEFDLKVADKTWNFGADGSLTLPDASVIASYKPVTVISLAILQVFTNGQSDVPVIFVDTVDSANAFGTNGTFTVPYTGYYQFNVNIVFTANISISSGFLTIANTTSGITTLDTLFAGQFVGQVINASSMLELTAGNTIKIFFRQVGAVDPVIDVTSRLTIHRVSIN